MESDFCNNAESGHRSLLIVLCFELRRRHVANRSQEPPHVEPVHPFQRGELHGFERAPRPSSSNHLSPLHAVRLVRARRTSGARGDSPRPAGCARGGTRRDEPQWLETGRCSLQYPITIF